MAGHRFDADVLDGHGVDVSNLVITGVTTDKLSNQGGDELTGHGFNAGKLSNREFHAKDFMLMCWLARESVQIS